MDDRTTNQRKAALLSDGSALTVFTLCPCAGSHGNILHVDAVEVGQVYVVYLEGVVCVSLNQAVPTTQRSFDSVDLRPERRVVDLP